MNVLLTVIRQSDNSSRNLKHTYYTIVRGKRVMSLLRYKDELTMYYSYLLKAKINTGKRVTNLTSIHSSVENTM